MGRRAVDEEEAEAVEEVVEREARGLMRRDLRMGEAAAAAVARPGLGREEVVTTGEGGLASKPAAARHSSGASMYFSTSCKKSIERKREYRSYECCNVTGRRRDVPSLGSSGRIEGGESPFGSAIEQSEEEGSSPKVSFNERNFSHHFPLSQGRRSEQIMNSRPCRKVLEPSRPRSP